MNDAHTCVETHEYVDAQESQGGGSFSSWSTLQSGHERDPAAPTASSNWRPESSFLDSTAPGANESGACISQPGGAALQALLECSQAMAPAPPQTHHTNASELLVNTGMGLTSSTATHTTLHPSLAVRQRQLQAQQQEQQPLATVVTENTASQQASGHWETSAGSHGPSDAAAGESENSSHTSRSAGPIGEGRIAPWKIAPSPPPLHIPELPSDNCMVCPTWKVWCFILKTVS